MYLKEIAISGFKSFADRTRLDLRRGVTAVVGPNGCGKSNIVDAIRWVLGEQSAKALRGSSMQEVIFEGTNRRKPLPVCQVALTFTDCEADLGTAFNEVEISRRVSREECSDYFINGKVSRLKDIQRLFANTGMGRVSYSFMLQGQIDQILSTNPAERRIIFEEAAGITLYKVQRKEALNKLSLVDANLARVTDVIEEIGRQIGSLKRQASKALRYQRMKHRLTHLDLADSAYRYSNLRESIAHVASCAEEVRKKFKAHVALLEADEEALAVKKSTRSKLFEKMQNFQQCVYSLRSDKKNADNQAEFAEIRSRDLQGRIAEYRKEIEEIESQKGALAERARNEAENKQMQLDVVDDSGRNFQERSNELARAQEELSVKEAELQRHRQEVLHAENSIRRSRSRCATLEVDLKTYQVKHASLAETILSLNKEVEVLQRDLNEIQHTLTKRLQEREDCNQVVEKARQDSKAILNDFRSLQERIQEQDRSIARKTARLNVLKELQAKLEGFGEGAKAIFGDKLNDVVSKGDVSIIFKELKVQSAYIRAIETLLGPAMEVLFIGNPDKALSVIRKLNEGRLGRACLQASVEPAVGSPGIDLPEHIVPASSVVNVRDESLLEAAQHLFSGCYLADSLEEFIHFWQENIEFNFLFVATGNGELVDCRGLIYGGKSSGKRSSSVFEREAEIRILRSEIESERQELNQLREEANTIDERRIAAEITVEKQCQRQANLGNEVSALVTEERGQKQKIEQNACSRHNAEEEIARLEASHGDFVQALEKARQDLETAEQGLADERQSGNDLEDAITRVRETRDQKREALADVRLELAEKKQHLESFDRTLGEVQSQSDSLQELILRRNQDIGHISEQIQKLKTDSSREVAKGVKLETALQVAAEDLNKIQTEIGQMDGEIIEVDGTLISRRNESRTLDQKLNKLEVRLAEERSQIGFIQSAAENDYQVDLGQVDWKVELWEGNVEFEKQVNLDELDDPDTLNARPKKARCDPTEEELVAMEGTNLDEIVCEVKELKKRIANIGPVNLDAIGEYADLKERHDFLKNQSEDLWNSKNTLIKTIDEINETSRNLFQETFEQVKKNFAITYGTISGGGDSDLKLTDSKDPLEAGIEIIARPPGTRLKSVTLLSGGQRTMTAVALLFAIFMVKPSPFCVLDEIDAALDDANIGRFCEILQRFKDKSQFIIITHNKRTISNADTVFGVTMPEKGVSTLISMRFNKGTSRPEMRAVDSQQTF